MYRSTARRLGICSTCSILTMIETRTRNARRIRREFAGMHTGSRPWGKGRLFLGGTALGLALSNQQSALSIQHSATKRCGIAHDVPVGGYAEGGHPRQRDAVAWLKEG